MKPILIAFATTICLAGGIEITNTKGRTLDVQVISAVAGNVRIAKADGREFVVSLDTLTESSREAISQELAKMEAEKPKPPSGITVRHVITKQVDGKFRYFFDIRNHEATPWTGSATITLLNTQPGVKNAEEKFLTSAPIQPKMGFVRFLEARTGPAFVHGDWSVAGFSYEIQDGSGKSLGTGKGPLGPKTDGF